MSQQDNKEMAKHFYRASAADFKKIPGSPIAYWVGSRLLESFEKATTLGEIAEVKHGLSTGKNSEVVRLWSEVSYNDFGPGYNTRDDAMASNKKWFPYNKGGDFRKWFGNCEYVLRYDEFGNNLMSSFSGHRHDGKSHYFLEGVTWTFISSTNFAARYTPSGFVFDVSGSSLFVKNPKVMTGFLCGKLCYQILKALNPTLNFQVGNLKSLPILEQEISNIGSRLLDISSKAINISKSDWDYYECSWDFNIFGLLNSEFRGYSKIENLYSAAYISWLETTVEMQSLEEENNRLFIEAYGLQEELTPEVPLSEITLTCNPHYRYGGNLTDQEREDRLQSDTIAELISYAIGCMMGRYSLDREGLVYAHAGNIGFSELVAEGAYQTFHADGDGILPLTSEHWFDDDVAARVDEFVRTVWGEEHLEENLQFIADSLCLSAIKPLKKSGETARETIRRYLSTQFFKDHLKTYKKRPIYWLFSSGKEKAFECLVYLHRYNEATLPRMRTEYVTPLLGQMAGRIERLRLQKVDAATAEAKRLDKEIDSLTKQLTELRAFDDQLKHYADMKIKLDLDDGVKVNYGKFGNLLAEVKAITGDKGE